jgi:uncharacterized protein
MAAEVDNEGPPRMQLVAVCIGKTREVDIQGATVQTAYLKTPVAGPCFVDYKGPTGNETAVHPDTVYAIAQEHYAYWAQRLGREASAWGYGYFAENLTIRGLAEQQLHVGDELLVGSELRLIVTGPRIPCFKVAWRMQQPQSFVRDFAASGRTGVYFAVLQPGTASPGDPVRVVRRQSANPTVFEIAAVARGELEISGEELERLLSLPYLSQTAALLLSGIYYRMLDRPDRARSWSGWRRFVVLDVRDETPRVKSFELGAADGGALPRFAAGQFVPVRFGTDDGQEFVRPWSLSSYAREPDRFRITVKREDRGAASAALHREVRQGSMLDLRPPAGQFRLDRSGVMPLVLVGAGIGVTPLLAMAQAHLDRGSRAPPLRLIHCVRNGSAHPLRQEIEALLRDHAAFQARFFYSQPTAADRESHRFHQEGRLTAERLIAALEDLKIEFAGKTIPVPWYEVDLYLCGPPSFLQQITEDLIARGARPERLRTERFSATAAETGAEVPDAQLNGGPEVSQAQVVFCRSGTEGVWLATQDQTLLEHAHSIGLELPSSCRSGYCQTCQCRIVEGEVRYEFAPLCAPTPGHALLCCARPASLVLVLDA